MISSVAVVVVIIVISSFFAAAEAAILSVNTSKIKSLMDEGSAKAKYFKKVTDNPGKYLSAAQSIVSAATLFAGAYAAVSFVDGTPSFIILIVLLSCFMLVFGELLPKRLAVKYSDALVLKLIVPFYILFKITHPFVAILTSSANFLARCFGVTEASGEIDVTEEEIRMMLDVGDAIDETEKEMINNIFEFDNKTVGNICTHRTDIIAVDITASAEEIINLTMKEGYSRIPVYDGNIDDIVGILNIKDLFIFFSKNVTHTELDIGSVMRKPVFVPLSKKTDELFFEMQKNKIHMAVVIDEYGGTVGLVTMEDLIEEVMGNILDEYDDEERPDIEAIDESAFKVLGATQLETVADFFGVQLPVADYDTVSGFIIGQIGKIPEENDRPEIEFNGLVFKVFKIFEKRITEIIVCKVQ